jgi:hypothetical protein
MEIDDHSLWLIDEEHDDEQPRLLFEGVLRKRGEGGRLMRVA